MNDDRQDEAKQAARQAAQRHLLSAAGRLGVVLPTLRAGGLKQVDKETL